MSETEKQDGLFTLTQPVIMTFPNLLEPKAFTEKGKAKGDPKYSANFNFKAGTQDVKDMYALAAKLARSKWPDRPFYQTTTEGEKIPVIVFPFTDGNKLADDRKAKGKGDGEFTRGKIVISARSKYPPRLSYIENGRIVDCNETTEAAIIRDKFFAGAEVLAQLNFVPYEAVGAYGKPGVTAYLNMVCATGKGKRLAGGKSAAETFRGYVGLASSENPLGNLGDEDLSDLVGM